MHSKKARKKATQQTPPPHPPHRQPHDPPTPHRGGGDDYEKERTDSSKVKFYLAVQYRTHLATLPRSPCVPKLVANTHALLLSQNDHTQWNLNNDVTDTHTYIIHVCIKHKKSHTYYMHTDIHIMHIHTHIYTRIYIIHAYIHTHNPHIHTYTCIHTHDIKTQYACNKNTYENK
jgi:hypothetical protein